MATKVYVAISATSKTGNTVLDDTAFTYAATFSSLSAAIADAIYGARDISSTTGSNETQYYDVFDSYPETVEVTTSGFTFIDDWVIIRAAPSYEHAGIPGTGLNISNSVGYASKFNFTGNTLVKNLEFTVSGSGNGSASRAVGFKAGAIGLRLIGRTIGTGGSAFWLNESSYTNFPTLIGCLAYNTYYGFRADNYTAGNLYGCTSLNCITNGFNLGTVSSHASVVKNCLALHDSNAASSVDFAGTAFTSTSSNNGSSDATAIGTSSKINLVAANEIVNIAGYDPHLKAGNTIETLGLDLVTSGDISAANNQDIDGQPFTGWPIGCDQPGAFTVPLKITCYDAETLQPIQGVDVYVYADTGGSLAAGTMVSAGTTDVNGEINTTPTYPGVQPVVMQGRKGTTSPFYNEGKAVGVMDGNGLTGQIYMVIDE